MSANTLPIRNLAEKQVGNWVTFRTPNGPMRGILEKVNEKQALIKIPYADAPLHLMMGSGHDFTVEKKQKMSHDIEQVAYYAPGGVGYGGVARPYGFGLGGGWWWWIWIPLIFLLFAFWW